MTAGLGTTLHMDTLPNALSYFKETNLDKIIGKVFESEFCPTMSEFVKVQGRRKGVRWGKQFILNEDIT